MLTYKLSELISIPGINNISTFEPIDNKILPNIFIVHGSCDGGYKCFLYNTFTKKTIYRFSPMYTTLHSNSAFKFVKKIKDIVKTLNRIYDINSIKHIIIYNDNYIYEINIQSVLKNKKIEHYDIFLNKIVIKFEKGFLKIKEVNKQNISLKSLHKNINIKYEMAPLNDRMLIIYPRYPQNINENNKCIIINVDNNDSNNMKQLSGYLHLNWSTLCIIEDKFIILRELNHYTIYNFIDNKEIDRIYINRVKKYNSGNGTEYYIDGKKIEAINNKYISVQDSNNNITKIYKFVDSDDIPEGEQCIICFNRTMKDKALIPCGHTQYCNKCIIDIKTCSLCRKEVEKIIKIYR